jgi:hypothetical protein
MTARIRKNLLRLLPLVAVLVVSMVCIGCGWTVTPPDRVSNPRVIFLSTYGQHSRVALQIDETRMIEYGFGDWRYYAVGEKSAWRGVMALAVPTESALGRRIVPMAGSADGFSYVAGSGRSALLRVERRRIDELVAALDARYRANLGSEISGSGGFTYVKDEPSYHLLKNSNHQAAGWLRELGCEVSGFPIISNFEVK